MRSRSTIRALSARCAGLAIALTAALAAHTAALAQAAPTCPAYGADTTCGTVITVSASGATVVSTGQGPYDGSDDTLVGVVNNSSVPLTKLKLTSINDVFGFDGDGIDTYGSPGNAQDNTGYGGPDSYFSNISPDYTSGEVDFVTPVAASGGTTYFSLEDALSNAISCQDAVNNAVSAPTIVTTTGISSTFTPNLSLSLSSAAQLCGFTKFDWQQTITSWPKPSSLYQVGSSTPQSTPPNFPDPVQGGYVYELTLRDSHGALVYPNGDNSFPFYYDANSGELASHTTSTTLSFSDRPTDPCLPGGSGANCIGGVGGATTAPAGSYLGFSTELAGVKSDGTAQPLGIGFTWTSTFNGTSGGVATTKNDNPVDPGSGTGGVTITGMQATASYSYNGVTVTAVNGTAVPTTAFTTTALVANPTTQTQGAAVTLAATVSTAASSAATGTVAFSAGSTPVAGCSAVALTATGTTTSQAVCTTTGLPLGTDSVSAVYGGDTGDQTSTSPAVTVTIVPGNTTTVNGSVPGTLALSVASSTPNLGAFTPGLAQTYMASTTASVTSTAQSATLTVADGSAFAPGHLVNGTYALAQPLQAEATDASNPTGTYAAVGTTANPLTLLTLNAPVSNDAVALNFEQAIGAGDPLRTGTYSTTLTFTLASSTL